MNTEQLLEIISIIGKDRIERVYDITKGNKISFAALNKHIIHGQIENAINSGHSFRKIASDFKTSRMTVYRIFKKQIPKKSHK